MYIKKFLIAIFSISILLSTSVIADVKPIDLKWTNKGLSIKSPQYKYQTNQLRSKYRQAERYPAQMTKKGFRNLDKNINKAISKKLNKLFN